MQDSLVCPRKFLDYKKSEGLIPDCEPPHTVIFTYQRSFFNQALSKLSHTQLTGSLHRLFILNDFPSIAIGHFGIGAPHVGAKMDMMIAWGVKRFISFGTAGALQPDLQVGDIVLCNRAIRDEGLSHHYLPRGKDVTPCTALTEKVKLALDSNAISYVVGATRTTDALFRQTAEDIKRYQNEGVMCTEMEAAALFAIAKHHAISIASAFVISDRLGDLRWNPAFDSDVTLDGWNNILNCVLEVAKKDN